MSLRFRAGLSVLLLLSVADLALPLLTNGENPPMAVALVAAVLGLASIALIAAAWRGARRAVVPLVVLRLLSAAAALPALFASGVPAGLVAVGATMIVLGVAGVVLVLAGANRATGVTSR